MAYGPEMGRMLLRCRRSLGASSRRPAEPLSGAHAGTQAPGGGAAFVLANEMTRYLGDADAWREL